MTPTVPNLLTSTTHVCTSDTCEVHTLLTNFTNILSLIMCFLRCHAQTPLLIPVHTNTLYEQLYRVELYCTISYLQHPHSCNQMEYCGSSLKRVRCPLIGLSLVSLLPDSEEGEGGYSV